MLFLKMLPEKSPGNDSSKWPPMNVVVMFSTFGEIKQMEKTALIQSPKT